MILLNQPKTIAFACIVIMFAFFCDTASVEAVNILSFKDRLQYYYDKGGADAAEEIYRITIDEAKQPEYISDPAGVKQNYLAAAGFCRDLGHPVYPAVFFELAVKEPSEDARAFKAYAEYLMGYRGYYEKAFALFQRALALVQKQPKSYSDEFKNSLDRSIEIMNRDAGVGFNLFPSMGKGISQFMAIEAEYSQENQGVIDLHIKQLRADRSGGMTDRSNVIHKQINQRVFSDVTIRPDNYYFPSFTFGFESTESPDSSVDPYNVTQAFDRDVETYFVQVDKHFLPYPALGVKAELSFLNTKNKVTDGNRRLSDEEKRQIVVDTQAAYYRKEWIYRLGAGASYADIDTSASSGDAAKAQWSSLRFSKFESKKKKTKCEAELKECEEKRQACTAKGGKCDSIQIDCRKIKQECETLMRFRGRESTHFEIGFVRNERNYRPPKDDDVKETETGLFSTLEFLGRINGKFDTYLTYQYHRKKLSGGDFKGTYYVHSIGIEPQWVPVYNLYHSALEDKLESVYLKIPLKYEIGDGPYDRMTGGVELQWRYLPDGFFSVEPRMGLEYSHYPEISHSNWAVVAQIRFGHKGK